MKYLLVLCDGMADEPLEELGGRTPLEAAATPNMDALAAGSEIGMVRTVPRGMAPGSDTANLSVLGYPPRQYYTGRSPLEALSLGVNMEPGDVALRCNLVTLTQDQERYEDRIILDHSAGETNSWEGALLLQALKVKLERKGCEFYAGTGYRHLLIRKQGPDGPELTPPHDILTQRIGPYLPEDFVLREMMEKSYQILCAHPLNAERKRQGRNPANSVWFWGAGTKPVLDSFEEKFQKKGVMISAVDLLKGIGAGTGLHNICVEGADGGLHTNYGGKAKAAVKALTQDGYDFAYVHVEAPDEMGHQGSAVNKITAIESIDRHIIGPAAKSLAKAGTPFRLLVLPDHPTPVKIRTHTADPVPYLLYDSRREFEGMPAYNEETAAKSGFREEEGHKLISRLFQQI